MTRILRIHIKNLNLNNTVYKLELQEYFTQIIIKETRFLDHFIKTESIHAKLPNFNTLIKIKCAVVSQNIFCDFLKAIRHGNKFLLIFILKMCHILLIDQIIHAIRHIKKTSISPRCNLTWFMALSVPYGFHRRLLDYVTNHTVLGMTKCERPINYHIDILPFSSI